MTKYTILLAATLIAAGCGNNNRDNAGVNAADTGAAAGVPTADVGGIGGTADTGNLSGTTGATTGGTGAAGAAAGTTGTAAATGTAGTTGADTGARRDSTNRGTSGTNPRP